MFSKVFRTVLSYLSNSVATPASLGGQIIAIKRQQDICYSRYVQWESR